MNSGLTLGRDFCVIKSNSDKLKLYKQTNKLTFFRYGSNCEVQRVELPKKNGRMKLIGISNMLDRVLQTQLCILLDAFYEPQYDGNIFSYRKGRNPLQAIALLRRVIDSTDKEELGVGLLDVKKSFDSVPHNVIIKNFLVPDSWKNIFQRWLKPRLYGVKGENLGAAQCGVPQGSVIGPMIWNVIINNALFKLKNVNLEGKYFLEIFNSLPSSYQKPNLKSRSKIYRSLIVYADDIVVTTNNSKELETLVGCVGKALNVYGLVLDLKKMQLIEYAKAITKKLRFDYLGYTFLYLPNNKIRRGGIITYKESIFKRKENLLGSHLLYPSSQAFQSIKAELKSEISKLSRLSVFLVIKKVNSILRS